MSSPLRHFYGRVQSKTILDAWLCHCSYKTHRLQKKSQQLPPEAVLMSSALLSETAGLYLSSTLLKAVSF